jgi:hypothetical protein
MSDRTTTSTAANPAPTTSAKDGRCCEQSCRFFGEVAASVGCCSKCFVAITQQQPQQHRSHQQKLQILCPASSPVTSAPPMELSPLTDNHDGRAATTAISSFKGQKRIQAILEFATSSPAASSPSPTKKRKKKKGGAGGYKSMLANMMATTQGSGCRDSEKDAWGQGLGGGAFTKVDKI